MKQKLEKCDVLIRFRVSDDKLKHVYEAVEALRKVGVTFDTGGCMGADEDGTRLYDWEFDWSLRGPIEVLFRKMKDQPKAESVTREE